MHELEEKSFEKGTKLSITSAEVKRLQLQQQKALFDRISTDVLAKLREQGEKVR